MISDCQEPGVEKSRPRAPMRKLWGCGTVLDLYRKWGFPNSLSKLIEPFTRKGDFGHM